MTKKGLIAIAVLAGILLWFLRWNNHKQQQIAALQQYAVPTSEGGHQSGGSPTGHARRGSVPRFHVAEPPRQSLPPLKDAPPAAHAYTGFGFVGPERQPHESDLSLRLRTKFLKQRSDFFAQAGLTAEQQTKFDKVHIDALIDIDAASKQQSKIDAHMMGEAKSAGRVPDTLTEQPFFNKLDEIQKRMDREVNAMLTPTQQGTLKKFYSLGSARGVSGIDYHVDYPVGVARE